MQKGSALPLVVLLIVVLGFGLYFFQTSATKESPAKVLIPSVSENKNVIFTSNEFNFQFEYPKDLSVKEDSEEEFNKRGNGDFRKNFTYYVTYPPAEVLGIVAVLDETNSLDEVTSSAYETSPLTIWVFNNPNNLTIEKWYTNFWYYPFVWGDYTERRNNVAPIKEATVSGQLAKYGVVSYRDGSPKFVYLKSAEKMYLFRLINDSQNSADKILESFKLLN